MTNPTLIRPLKPQESHILSEMMYEALFVAPGETPPTREHIWKPAVSKYHAEWGKPGDLASVAMAGKKPVGAAWCRVFKLEEAGYGFVDEDTPELVIAVKKGYRGNGIGTRLLSKLFTLLAKENIHRLSLSVQKQNRATKLYRRMGFKSVNSSQTAYTMLKTWP